MNKLDALTFFVVASETLNFRETAVKLAISPSVVTRTIAELENQLGEPLFIRNTRSIVLTHFGEQFFPKAKRLLADADALFQQEKLDNEMKGLVRITLPRLPHHEQILFDLLTALRPYPELLIDWRLDMMRLDNVQYRIDMGIRVGLEPNPNFIIRPIAQVEHIFVASPDLLERLGEPTDFEDLRERYPFGGLLNFATGKPWDFIGSEQIAPRHIEFMSTEPQTQIQAALAGRVVIQASNLACKQALADGKLVQLLPEMTQQKWQLYLYRPYQTMTPKRVTIVFEILAGILRKYYLSVL